MLPVRLGTLIGLFITVEFVGALPSRAPEVSGTRAAVEACQLAKRSLENGSYFDAGSDLYSSMVQESW